ncbi:MAG: phytanoyl-CoA dioxygenase family protein [Paracoccaceae bacterium]
MDWLQSVFPVEAIDRVTNHAWAKTYRVTQRGGRVAYLKILPPVAGAPAAAIAQLSQNYAPAVPALIAIRPESGFFLYDDHGGKDLGRSANSEDKTQILSLYAGLQADLRGDTAFLASMPRVFCPAQFDLFELLLRQAVNGTLDETNSGNPFQYFPRDELVAYEKIFSVGRGLLRDFLLRAEDLEITLNHGDLRTRNIARRADGDLCLFDWDDMVSGPPGLSLHALFGGCHRVCSALGGQGRAGDRKNLETYIGRLTQAGTYNVADLRRALPAVACAGVFRYINGFARYPTTSKSTQKAIVSNVAKRMSDLMDLLVDLAMLSLGQADAMASAFQAGGRSKRAEQLSARLQNAVPNADRVETFPQIELSKNSVRSGKISKQDLTLATETFRRDGALLIPDAFPVDLVRRCHDEFESLRDEHEKTIQDGGALRVGNKRFMISLTLAGTFAESALLASPIVLPILQKLLSDQAILGSLTAVASMPGSQDQRLHRDNPALFCEDRDLQTPSFSIAMIVPLIPLNTATGATRVMKGSHLLRGAQTKDLPLQEPQVELGSCYLMDCRLYHQGMANKSDQIRPILSLVYQRPWYRDPENFQQQSPLILPQGGVGALDKKTRSLVEWAANATLGGSE